MKQRAALKDNTRKLVDECGAKDTLYKPPQAPMAKKDYTNICSATRKCSTSDFKSAKEYNSSKIHLLKLHGRTRPTTVTTTEFFPCVLAGAESRPVQLGGFAFNAPRGICVARVSPPKRETGLCSLIRRGYSARHASLLHPGIGRSGGSGTVLIPRLLS